LQLYAKDSYFGTIALLLVSQFPLVLTRGVFQPFAYAHRIQQYLRSSPPNLT
jgi:hypothetical protein